MPLSVPLNNYPERLEDAFETAEEELKVLYMGEEKEGYIDTLKQVLNYKADKSGYETDVEIYRIDIDKQSFENEQTRQIQGDSARLPLSDNSIDLVVTNHLLCNPESEADLEDLGAECLEDQILQEAKRVSKKADSINEAC